MTGSKRAWWPGDRNTAIAGCDRAAANAVTSTAPAEAMTQVRNAYHLLTSQVAPHENAEDTQLYPAVNRLLGGGQQCVADVRRTNVPVPGNSWPCQKTGGRM